MANKVILLLSSRHTRVIPSQNIFQEWNLPKPLIHGNPGLFPLGNLPRHPNQNEHLFLWHLPHLRSAPLLWHWSQRDLPPWLPFCSDVKLNKWLPWWLRGQESACWCRRLQFDTWFGNIPWRRKWQPTPVFMSGKFHEQRSLEGHSPRGCKTAGHRIANKPQQQKTNKGTARAPPPTKPVPGAWELLENKVSVWVFFMTLIRVYHYVFQRPAFWELTDLVNFHLKNYSFMQRKCSIYFSTGR